MKVKIFVSFVFLFSAVFLMPASILAQEVKAPRRTEVFDPSVLETRKLLDTEKSGADWYVYSDKEGNKIYSQPSFVSSVKSLKASFLQEFFVIKETEKFVEVADPGNPTISLGYIPKKRLILIPRCIMTRNKVLRKAMIINNLEDFSQARRNRFYNNPQLTKVNNESVDIYTVCYVYKESDSAYLLSSKPDCGNNAGPCLMENVYGWIHKSKVTPWNNRGCLLPDYENYAERINKYAPAALFTDPELAIDYLESRTFIEIEEKVKNYQENPIPYKEEPFTTSRWNKGKYRFPFLEGTSKTGILKVGVLGDIRDTAGRVMTKIIDSLRANYNSELRNLNVVFVIDATASMREYFPEVVKSISESTSRISANKNFGIDSTRRVTVNWGAVVYRDTEDEYTIEKKDLTSNDNEIRNFLANAYDPAKNTNTTICESVYYGLYNGLNMLYGKENENNLIILIGDVGDHQRQQDYTYTEADELIDLLTMFNCNLMVYQTEFDQRLDDIARDEDCKKGYTKFKSQMKYIAEIAAQNIYKKRFPNDELEIKLVDNHNKHTYFLNQNILANRVIYNTGGKMDKNLLRENIVESIYKSAESVNNFFVMLHKLLYSGKSIEEIMEELNLKGEMTMEEFRLLIFVRDELRKATPYSPDSPEFDSIFKSLLSSKVQRYFEGYAPISASNFEPRIWKFEVLTESSTFNDLRFRIQEALLDFDKGSESDIRKSFEQTLRDLADVYVGESAGKHGDVTVGKLFEEMIAVPGITFSKKYNDALDIKIKDIDPECPVDYLYTISDALAYSDAYLELVKFDKDGTDAFINFIAYWIKLEYFPFMDQE